MPKLDLTPFRDARNVVGLLTDVLDLALAGPSLSAPLFTDHEMLHVIVLARDLGREFAKSPRRVFNGHARKTSANLYQRVKAARAKIPADLTLMRGDKTRELYATTGAISDLGLRIAEKMMEDAEQWKPYTLGWVERRYGKPVAHDPQWHKDWHDHISAAMRLGADRNEIANLEVSWRFRDLTDRSHRGRNIRAAFEAAWLAGQYKFAMQLISEAR